MSDLTILVCVAGGSLFCLVVVIWLVSKLAPDLNPQKKKGASVQPSPQPVAVIPTAAPTTNPTAPATQASANASSHDPRLAALLSSIVGIVALAFLASTWLPNSHVIETTRELGLGTILIASVAALVAWNWGGKAGRTVAILLAIIAGYKLLAVNSLLSLPPGAIWLIALAIGIVLLFLQNKNATRLGWIVLVLSFVFWMISPQGPSWPASWTSRSSSAQAAESVAIRLPKRDEEVHTAPVGGWSEWIKLRGSDCTIHPDGPVWVQDMTGKIFPDGPGATTTGTLTNVLQMTQRYASRTNHPVKVTFCYQKSSPWPW